MKSEGKKHSLKRLIPKRQVTAYSGHSVAPPSVMKVLRSSGQPLDTETRSLMEPLFAFDLSHVRVHTDQQAVESASALNAHAYTFGQNVMFGAGQYAPRTTPGKRLLGHELTHVIQQNPLASFSLNDNIQIGPAYDAFEQEADLAGRMVMDNQAPLKILSSTTVPVLQRSVMPTDYCLWFYNNQYILPVFP